MKRFCSGISTAITTAFAGVFSILRRPRGFSRSVHALVAKYAITAMLAGVIWAVFFRKQPEDGQRRFHETIQAFQSVEGAVALAILGVGFCALMPLSYLRPKAKAKYLPYALILLIADGAVAVYFLVTTMFTVSAGGLIAKLVVLIGVALWAASSAVTLLQQVHVCERCGTMIDRKNEAHKCPDELP